MKEQTSAMRGILVYLLAFFTLTLNSCKKDLAYNGNNEPPISSIQTIEFADIQAYIDESTAMGLLSLDWKNARQTTIGNKNVVRVPTLNVDKTAAFFKNNASSNNGSRGTQASGTSVGNGTFNEGNNVNYDAKHPPEVFFIQQSGHNSVNAYLLNFVPDNKEKENGENGIWTGKLLEWNLTGDTVLVQEIKKSELKELYTISLSSVNNDSVKVREEGDFWRKVRDTLEDFVGWVGSLFGISTRSWDPYYGGWQWRLDPVFGWATGGYGGSNDDDGNSGGRDYYGAGYPVYDDYIPGYQPSNAFGAPSYPTNNSYSPYRGGPNVSSSPYSSSLNYLVDNLNLTQEQIEFLEARDDIAQRLKKYLQKNGLGTEEAEFAEWAVGYLKENPYSFDNAFSDLLNGVYNENSPIYIPYYFTVAEDATWNDIEDEVGYISAEISQQGLPYSDPIPESYYKNGTAIDMSKAPAQSRTVKGAPRNAGYFWKELIKKRPEMFSKKNRDLIAANKLKDIEVDDQWIKYNPTHKSYKNNQLVHTYDVYADYIWDADEKRYMGFLKLGTFTEDIDMLTSVQLNLSLSCQTEGYSFLIDNISDGKNSRLFF